MSQGSVTKRGDSWMLKWELPRDPNDPTRRRHGYKSVRVPTKKEAQAELRKVLSTMDNGTYVEPQRIPLKQWIATWLKDHIQSKVSTSTFERYEQLLTFHVVPHIGEVQMQKLTSGHIESLYATLRREGRRSKDKNAPPGLSEQTLLHVHRVLGKCLRKAFSANIIGRNPIDKDKVDAPKPGKAKAAAIDQDGGETNICALERDELDRLLAGFQGHSLFPVVVLAAGTGIRRGEMLALRWADVDLENLRIRVDRSIEDTKAHGLRFKVPKTKGSRRTIGIDGGLGAMLRQHWKRQAEDAIKLGRRATFPAADALLFPRSPMEPATPTSPRAVTKAFVVKARKLGFGSLRLHDLRHTHATQLLSAGVPVHVVSQRLGHSTPMITLNVYGHVLRRAEDQAVSVSAGLLEAGLRGA